MKKKSICTLSTEVFNQYKNPDILKEFTTYKYTKPAKTQRDSTKKTTKSSPIRYNWKTSIPNKWFTLVDPSRFEYLKNQNQSKRNTLKFLEETQKYIFKIRKPISNSTLIESTIKPTINSTIKPTQNRLIKNQSLRNIHKKITSQIPKHSDIFPVTPSIGRVKLHTRSCGKIRLNTK